MSSSASFVFVFFPLICLKLLQDSVHCTCVVSCVHDTGCRTSVDNLRQVPRFSSASHVFYCVLFVQLAYTRCTQDRYNVHRKWKLAHMIRQKALVCIETAFIQSVCTLRITHSLETWVRRGTIMLGRESETTSSFVDIRSSKLNLTRNSSLRVLSFRPSRTRVLRVALFNFWQLLRYSFASSWN